MNSEILFNSNNFDWLDEKIQRGQARPEYGMENHRNVQFRNQPGVPRLPVDFSTEAAMLKGKQLRALKFGEWLGSGARAVVQRIAILAAWLKGNTQGF